MASLPFLEPFLHNKANNEANARFSVYLTSPFIVIS